MKKFQFKVENMDCPSCAEAIRRKLQALEGVSGVDIDLKEKKVSLQSANPNLCQEDLTCVMEDMGYKAQVP